jgi:O-antigen ligase
MDRPPALGHQDDGGAMSTSTSSPRLGASLPSGGRARALWRFRAGRVHLALLGLAIAALPLLLPKGPGNTAPVDAFAIVYVLVALLAVPRLGRRLRWPAGAAVLLMLAAAVIATLASEDVGLSLLTLAIEAYLFLLFFGVANDLAEDRRGLRVVLVVWVLAAVAWAALPVLVVMNVLPHELPIVGVQGERPAAAAGNPNLLGSYLVTSFFVVLASPWPRARLLRLLVAGWVLWGVWLTGSNGGLSGLLVGLAVLGIGAMLRRSRTREQVFGLVGGLLLVGVALLVGGVALLQWQAGRNPIQVISQETTGSPFGSSVGRADKGLEDRLDIWRETWDAASQHVVLGIGPGQFVKLNLLNPKGVARASTHNDYLSEIVERGLLGLIGYLALCWMLVRWGGRLLGAEGDGRSTHRALAGAVWANLAFGLAHETYHFRHVWMLYALVWVAAHQLGTTEPSAAEPSADEPSTAQAAEPARPSRAEPSGAAT